MAIKKVGAMVEQGWIAGHFKHCHLNLKKKSRETLHAEEPSSELNVVFE